MSRLNNLYLFLNDEKGRTLPRAKLFFYENNSFDFKNTYADKALTSINPNPVIADGAGRFPNIFLEADTYRVVLQDEDGVEISTKDDVDNLLSDGDNISNTTVATSTGSQTVAAALDARVIAVDNLAGLKALDVSGFTGGEGARITGTGRAGDFEWRPGDFSGGVASDPQQGIYVPPNSDPTGASGCWLRKETRVVNIEWFGAVAGTNSTVAIDAAIDNGRDIIIPPSSSGAFLVEGLEINSKSNFRLYGGGELKLIDGGTTRLIQCLSCTNFRIYGLKWNGNKANRTAPASRNNGAGISVDACKMFSIYENEIYNTISGAGILAVDDGQPYANLKTGGFIYNNYIHDLGVIGGTSAELSDGMFINSDNSAVSDNVIENVSDYGIAGDYSQNLTIRGNKIHNSLVGIGILGAINWDVTDNAIDVSGLGIAVTLSGNSAVSPFTSHDVYIAHNKIDNITRDASGTPNGDGIFVDPSATGVTILSNHMGTVFRGIGCSAPNAIVCNNKVKDATDRHLFVSGTGSVVIGNKELGTGAGTYYGLAEGDSIIIDDRQLTWIDITTFLNGWANFGSPYANASYKVKNGRCYLRGALTDTNVSNAGEPIFNLPAPNRPTHNMKFIVAEGNTGNATVEINTAGDVRYRNGAGVEMHLDGIMFDIV